MKEMVDFFCYNTRGKKLPPNIIDDININVNNLIDDNLSNSKIYSDFFFSKNQNNFLRIKNCFDDDFYNIQKNEILLMNKKKREEWIQKMENMAKIHNGKDLIIMSKILFNEINKYNQNEKKTNFDRAKYIFENIKNPQQIKHEISLLCSDIIKKNTQYNNTIIT